MVASGQHRWAGCGWGLGESESLNSRKQQTRKGPARTAALRLLSQGLSHPQVLRLPQILSQACHGFPLQYLLPTPKRAQLSPSGHPVTSTHTAQGSGQRARNSIGATSSHLESWGKSIYPNPGDRLWGASPGPIPAPLQEGQLVANAPLGPAPPWMVPW